MHCVWIPIAIVCVALAATLITLGCTMTPQKLHRSSVGPEVYHPEVHTEVRRRWTNRIADEIDLSEYNLRHNPGYSNLFAGYYRPHSRCCAK